MKSAKLQEMLMKTLMPIANKVEQNRYLGAVKDGMVANVPIIIVGSFCTLPIALGNLFGDGSIGDFFRMLTPILGYAGKFTTDILSVYSALFIANALASRYKIQNGETGIIAILFHLLLCGVVQEDGSLSIAYLGASGLFASVISGIVSVEITRFMENKGLMIRLPNSVPPMVAESFAALFPLVGNTAVALILTNLSTSLGGDVFPALLMKALAPAISSMDSLPMLLIVIFLSQLFWFFGLHGASITSAVWSSFAIAYGTENIAAYAAGQPIPHIFTYALFNCVLQATGSGLTLGLVIFMLRSKAKSFSAMGKAAIIPSLFGINEPVIFGVPIILNPFLFIPFVFGPLVVTLLTWFSMSSGLVMKPIANPPGFMPPGVGAFLMTFDWKIVVLVFVCIAFMALFYYPFFKLMEAEELKKEQAAERK